MALKDLEINGKDLMELGVPQGRMIGEILATLYDRAIMGNLENNREQLLSAARQRIDGEFTEM